ncbi:DNA mismatch repair protein MutL [Rhexocercosporidium sp. MPI-PUGE-AT-0058]|nr:DNA mismatch repair protein MutL [Rhexocercosporidium sp. MPI-PUGE-AT-0058]
MATIKAIEGKTVHQIQSGQVIVDLCSVVKELVENCLDAGATNIDVRFKNQGLDAIEVQDNGDGISPHNYDTLALKHHTSKLSTYSDLTTLQTFGFRGEALSSLCALSKFSVVTCMAADAPKGTKLEFEVSGKLKGTSVVAAQKGTTVAVENLFNNLPVRRRELERNIKREWNRVVGVLGQYACIQTGIRFSVSQQAGKGKKTTLFSTKGNQSTRENIVNVFGAKTLTALIALELNLELEATTAPSQRWSTQDDGGSKEIRIVGHISRPASGEGRQTPDRQMFFVNARPCVLPQVAKAFNEVYKAYNGTQSPFIFANIELDTHLYDVNVSPDKRTILLHDQNRMLENLKEALTALFESQDYTVPISQLPIQKQPTYKQLTISREISGVPQVSPTPAELTEAEESENSRSFSREPDEDDVGTPARNFNPLFRPGAVSRESMSKDSGAVNLMSKWVGRKAEDRVEQDEEDDSAPRPSPKILVGLSEEKRRLVENLRGESEEAQAAPDSSEESESPGATSRTTNAPATSAKPPVLVSAFDRQLSEAPTISSERGSVDPELPIPALQPIQKPTPSIADRFSSTPRTQRPAAEIATITIGDSTVTSSIGTPCPKRPRIDDAPSTSRGRHPTQALKATLPSFGKSLSQMFAAPGTAGQSVSDDDIEDDSDDNVGRLSAQVITGSVDGSAEAEETGEDQEMHDESQPRAHVTHEPDSSLLSPEADKDEDYVDEADKKALEEAKIQEMIEEAEKSAMLPSQENVQRAKGLLKGGPKKKDATLNLVRLVDTDVSKITEQYRNLEAALSEYQTAVTEKAEDEALDSEQAEEKLSLTISKADFARMKIIGQFNLGFILATRASGSNSEDGVMTADDMFIIDQHASDEKYNFERLQATTIVQSQRLVYPKTLDLTALEEEIVMENLSALETNGFVVTVDESGESPVGNRCQLVSLPLSRETAFSLTDLEELISLLAEHPPGTVPRPAKVRKMFAMRACRSSIMIGKTLTHKQMGKVVTHLGELDKPWNCPHGRPTMRHLCGLGQWESEGWKDDQRVDKGGEKAVRTDWVAYVRRNGGISATPDPEETEGEVELEEEEEEGQNEQILEGEDISEDGESSEE